jgi:hypothetical protein
MSCIIKYNCILNIYNRYLLHNELRINFKNLKNISYIFRYSLTCDDKTIKPYNCIEIDNIIGIT